MSDPQGRSVPRDGPLVPLDGVRFRVALQESGLGLAGLIRAINVGSRRVDQIYKQALHHHYHGKGTRIRAKVRSRLAEALDVPEDWLAGEDVWTPYSILLPLWEPLRRSTRVSWAITRLTWRAVAVIERDIQAEPQRAATPEGHQPAQWVLHAMSMVIARLVNVVRGVPFLLSQRHRLYPGNGVEELPGTPEPLPFDSPSLGVRRGEPLHPAVEQGYMAALRAVNEMLEPWLSGKMTLDYAALLDLAEAVNPGKANFPPMFDHASSEDIARWARTARTSPYALIDWPAMDGRASAPIVKGLPKKRRLSPTKRGHR